MTVNKPKRVRKPSYAKAQELSTQQASKLVAGGLPAKTITPLEIMHKVMHELYEEADKCTLDGQQVGDLFGDALVNEGRIKLLNMAAAVGRHAAPYMHARLSAIEHTGKDGAPLQSGVLVVPSLLSLEEWEKAAQAVH